MGRGRGQAESGGGGKDLGRVRASQNGSVQWAGGRAGSKQVQSSGDKIWVVMANEATSVVTSKGSVQGKVVIHPKDTTTQRLRRGGYRGACRLPGRVAEEVGRKPEGSSFLEAQGKDPFKMEGMRVCSLCCQRSRMPGLGVPWTQPQLHRSWWGNKGLRCLRATGSGRRGSEAGGKSHGQGRPGI